MNDAVTVSEVIQLWSEISFPIFGWNDWRKTMKNFKSWQAEIRTRYLQNKSQAC